MLLRPAASISALGGAAIRPLREPDYPLVLGLHAALDNSTVAASLAVEDPGFVAAARAEPWASPMVLSQDGEEGAMAVVGAADSQNRHGRLVVIAKEPERWAEPLAIYVRHVFWSHPLHRLYSLVPVGARGSHQYLGLLRACGFASEGRLVRHQRVGTRLVDLELLALLRPEFDAWCRDHQPGLAL